MNFLAGLQWTFKGRRGFVDLYGKEIPFTPENVAMPAIVSVEREAIRLWSLRHKNGRDYAG